MTRPGSLLDLNQIGLPDLYAIPDPSLLSIYVANNGCSSFNYDASQEYFPCIHCDPFASYHLCWNTFPAYTLSSSFNDTGFAEILIKFKQSLTNTDQLQSWTLPVVEHLCINGSSSWTGVICRGDMITGLRLENMRLGGKIDVDLLSQLPLFSLSLSNNNFSGRFPSDVKKLVRVRRLLLSNNSLSGEIPGDAFMGMNMF